MRFIEATVTLTMKNGETIKGEVLNKCWISGEPIDMADKESAVDLFIKRNRVKADNVVSSSVKYH